MLFLWLAVIGVIGLCVAYLALRALVGMARWAITTVPMLVVFGGLILAFMLGSR